MIKPKSLLSGLSLILLGVLAMVLASCQQNDIDDDPSFNMFTVSLKGETGEDEILSDICVRSTGSDCTFFNDVAVVTIENMAKSSHILPSETMDVVVEKYEVYYVRRDEGTEVPPSISHRVLWWIPINETQTFNFSIVTHEQKLLPPLDNLREIGYDEETGNYTIETDAHVTFRGKTRTGINIVIRSTIPIKFADFAD